MFAFGSGYVSPFLLPPFAIGDSIFVFPVAMIRGSTL